MGITIIERDPEPVTIRYNDFPDSFNATGFRRNQWAVDAEKQRWQAIFLALLSGVPERTMTVPKPGTKHKTMDVYVQRFGELRHPVERIVVEGRLTFPTRHSRDQGNFRIMIEKALGDALEQGGWLDGDDWARYEFGGLSYAYKKGVKLMELVLFPTVESLVGGDWPWIT